MLEIAREVLEAAARGPVAVATVVRQSGSAPRSLGTSMAVDAAGAVIGSISGGCVEGAVYEAASRVLASGVAEHAEFGYSDSDAFAVGLSCGGRIDVVITKLDTGVPEPGVRDELVAASAGRPAALEVVVDGAALGRVQPVPEGERSSTDRTRVVDSRCEAEPVRALRLVTETRPTMLVYGAVDFGAALAEHALLLGYRVIVVDARPLFATGARFPADAEVVVDWPDEHLARVAADPAIVDERTVIAVLTHSDRFDVPLLRLALTLPVAYVGAMGSRTTDARRRALLVAAGSTDTELASLHSPIGLDLGGATPQEAAISILAEVIATRTGRGARPLGMTTGSIHAESVADEATESRA